MTPLQKVQRAIATQKQIAAEERRWWNELRRMAEGDDVSAWYGKYAEYLEWVGIVSPQRQLIHKMAKRVEGQKPEA